MKSLSGVNGGGGADKNGRNLGEAVWGDGRNRAETDCKSNSNEVLGDANVFGDEKWGVSGSAVASALL